MQRRTGIQKEVGFLHQGIQIGRTEIVLDPNHTVSFVLSQPLKDTLCGTKVLRRSDYNKIHRQRDMFGAKDPFGDFDLLFGAWNRPMIFTAGTQHQEKCAENWYFPPIRPCEKREYL